MIAYAFACGKEPTAEEKSRAGKKRVDAARAELLKRNLPAVSDRTAIWKQFRTAYPYHVQVLGLSDPASDGSRVLVISEPPPHVAEADILAPLAQILLCHAVERQRIGYDGWVRDMVVAVSGQEPQLTQAISALYGRLFFTTYKAYVLPLPAQAVQEHVDLDLKVTAAELSEWVLHGHDTYRGADTDTEITLDGLVSRPSCGVYPSTHGGLVGWWVPTSVEVDRCRTSIRQFTLDSDLIVGAVGIPGGTLILGRERIVPVESLPPLRFETISLLASSARSGSGQLAQSYERQAQFAGRIDAKHDWAPILLSPELRDAEYGSLLNITDQLLKGWSNAGKTHYVSFEYQPPPEWPFDRPLPLHLGVSEVVYNWNTAGAAYSVDLGNAKVIALNRTGALPVSYIPEGTSAEHPSARVTAAEDRAYGYFAGLSDPNLVRVVQYAALYEIFSTLGVHNRPLAGGGEYAQQRLEEVTTGLSAEIGRSTDAQLRALARGAAPVLTESMNYPSADADAIALKVLESFRKSPGNFVDFRARMILSAVAGQRKLHLRYARDVSARTKGWIHTPAVVLSWNDEGKNMVEVGGHNIGAGVTGVSLSERVRPGTVDVESGGGIVVNPHDAERVGHVIRAAGRFERAPAETRRRHIEVALASAPHDPVRSRAAALRLPAEDQHGSRLALVTRVGEWAHRVVIGWFPSTAEAALQPRNVAQIAVRRLDGGYILQNGTSTAYRALTVDGAAEAIVNMMGNERLRGNALALELHGFEEPEATGFVRTCEIRAHSSGSRRVMSAQVDDGKIPEEVIRAFQSLKLDLSRAKIVPKDVGSTGPAIETGFTVEIPTGERTSALLDVDLAFDKRVGETRVRVVLGRTLAWLRAFIAEPRASIDLWLLNHRVNQAIKAISIEEGASLHRVGQKFRLGQHDVHFVNLRHEQRDSTATGRPA